MHTTAPGAMAHDPAWRQTEPDDAAPDAGICNRCGDRGEFLVASSWDDEPDQRMICECPAGDELWERAETLAAFRADREAA